MALVLWHDGVGEGHGRCILTDAANGHRLAGQARLHGGGELDYVVECDASWEVDAVHARLRGPDGAITELDAARGAAEWRPDVWFDFAPAGLTPTLQRRVGSGPATYDVLRISARGLVLSHETHRLEHVGGDLWRHDRPEGSHAVHLGPRFLVTEYEDAWKAVALG